MIGNSPSTGPAAQDDPLCEWCNVRLRFHSPSALSRHASLNESREAIWNAYRAGQALATPSAAPAADGSSLTRRGDRGSRSWFVTGSSGLVCRRLRRKKYDYIWERVISQLGMDTGKTSDSSKSSIVEVGTIGTGVPTPADDCDKGWMGIHLWGYVTSDEGNLFCLNCGRRR